MTDQQTDPQTTPPAVAVDRNRKPLIIGLAIIAGVVAIAAGSVLSHTSSPGTMSAAACQNVVSAARDVNRGSRSLASFRSTVASQEGKARSAADSDGRYAPILQDIVQLREGLDAGDTTITALPGLDDLVNQCG